MGKISCRHSKNFQRTLIGCRAHRAVILAIAGLFCSLCLCLKSENNFYPDSVSVFAVALVASCVALRHTLVTLCYVRGLQ